MKRRLLSLLLILLLLAALLPAAFAEGAAEPEESPAPEASAAPVFPYVLDQAGLLRDSQREALEQKAAALSEQHQCALYIVTVQDHTQYNPDVYEAVKALNVGDTVDLEGFLYWYEGANPHITSVTVK